MSYDLSMCDGKTIANIEVLHPGDDQVQTQTVKLTFTDGHQLVLQARVETDGAEDDELTSKPATFSVACTIAPVYRPDVMGYAVARAVQ